MDGPVVSNNNSNTNDPDEKTHHRSQHSPERHGDKNQNPKDDRDERRRDKQQQQQRQHRPAASSSRGSPEEDEAARRKRKKEKKSKKKRDKTRDERRSSRHHERPPATTSPSSSVDHKKPSRPPEAEVVEGVTVSQFMRKQQSMQDKQKSMQDQASARRDASMRKRMHQHHYQQHQQQQQQQRAGMRPQIEGEQPIRRFDDDDSDRDEHQRAVVPRDNNAHSSNDVCRPVPSRVVDAVPADRPSSSVIQKFRTCASCHRTLPRSQFSERDRYSISPNLAPGAACRTCSMTICAAKLKSMPGTERLLLEYARRGTMAMQIQQQQQQQGQQGRVTGLLEGGSGADGDGNALVVRQNTLESHGAGLVGRELTLYDGSRGAPNNDPRRDSLLDVNSAHSGRPYGHTDGDRPPSVADCRHVDALLRMPCYLNVNALGLFRSSAEASVSVAALEAVRAYGTLGEGCFAAHDCDGRPVAAPSSSPPSKDGSGNEGIVDPRSVACLVLGEGSVPRTSVLASQHYGWTALAVDPLLSEEWDGCHDDVPGFAGYSGGISDYMGGNGEFSESAIEFQQRCPARHLVIVAIRNNGSDGDGPRLRGNAHIEEIRSRYEDVPTTLVSVSPVRRTSLAPSSRRAEVCGSKLEKDVGYEPNCAYVDEGVFSECRMVEVWNFHNAEGEDEDEDDDGSHVDDGERSREKQGADGDYVPKKRNEEENATPEEGTAARPGGSRQRKESPAKPDDKQSSGRNSGWLEDRVAEFNEKKKKKKNPSPAKGRERGDSTDASSTEGAFDRKNAGPIARESNPFVVQATPATRDVNDRDASDVPGGGRRRRDDDNGISEEGDAAEEKEEGEKEEEIDDAVAAEWSPPDEEVANQVWEKALAKHGEQEFCNQFEEYYGNGAVDDAAAAIDRSEKSASETSDMQLGLPPGWEAIHDPSSGEYYYNNWQTKEVTWDRPGEGRPAVEDERDRADRRDEETPDRDAFDRPPAANPFDDDDDGPLDDGPATDDDDLSKGTDDSPSAAVASPQNDNPYAPPLVQYSENRPAGHNLSRHSQSDASDVDYVFDDHSDASSGIEALTGALSRWNNKPSSAGGGGTAANKGAPLATTLERSVVMEEDDDHMIVWSDDEAAGADGGEDSDRFRPMERSQSGLSLRNQPWHKKDNEGLGSNDDSFIYE